MKVTFYTLVKSTGDGSAITKVFESRAAAEAYGQADFEKWGDGYSDSCIDEHTLTFALNFVSIGG